MTSCCPKWEMYHLLICDSFYCNSYHGSFGLDRVFWLIFPPVHLSFMAKFSHQYIYSGSYIYRKIFPPVCLFQTVRLLFFENLSDHTFIPACTFILDLKEYKTKTVAFQNLHLRKMKWNCNLHLVSFISNGLTEELVDIFQIFMAVA